MDLSEIVSVSGLPGLHRLKSQTGEGFIVQSLENNNIKFIRNVANRLVPLENITIYTTEEEDIELAEVFKRMLKKEKENLFPGSPKAEEEELRQYFETVVPEHDESQVYPSDIKKAIQWYQILREQSLLTEEDLSTEKEEEGEEEKEGKGKQAQQKKTKQQQSSTSSKKSTS